MSFERRIHVHSFVARLYFYVPVLVHHMERELDAAAVPQARAWSLSLLSLLSIGMIVAEYPSGLFSDWLGRRTSIVLSGVLHAGGVMLFLVPGSLVAMCAAQLLIGVATAFRSGSDSALVHSHLERKGEAFRYGAALARLRFYNVAGIAVASAIGGALYQWDPRSVFVLSALATIVGTSVLLGLHEPAITRHRRRYGDVLRESIAELRGNPAALGLTILGGVGNPTFVLAFWVTQTYLIDIELPFALMGLSIASMSFLQALTMPLSAWLGGQQRRLVRVLPLLVLLPAAAFAVAALAFRTEHTALGAISLVLANGCHVLYRNAVNVRLQTMVPDRVRSSVVSVEAGIGSLWYALLFPLAGVLLSRFGLASGLLYLAAIAAATTWLPLTASMRRGALR